MTNFLIDLDGTLLDHDVSMMAAVASFAAAEGAPFGAAESVRAWEDLRQRAEAPALAGTVTWQHAHRQIIRDFLPTLKHADDDTLDAAYGRCMNLYEEYWTPFSDTANFLARLRTHDGKVGVLTNADADMAAKKLRRLDADFLLPTLFASSELGAAKPAAAVFEQATARLGVSASDTVMVGDNLTADIDGALAAGLQAIWLNRLGTASHPTCPTVLTLDDVWSAVDRLGQ